tara:strand:- start:1556 stop:2107 length:552 start_codon:yes stop_codon:yes gene_type:complete
MHKNLYKQYYFIKKFNIEELSKLNPGISIIFRNYNNKLDKKLLISLTNFCHKKNIKVYLANNVKLAIKFNFDGAYIPAFNKDFRSNSFKFKKKFHLIGSAHNLKEIRIKEKQNINEIFIASLFKIKKTYLGINKFKNLSNQTNLPVIALGGINYKNIKSLNLIKLKGFSGIKYFKNNCKKKGP